MKLLAMIWDELFGLFVDDVWLAAGTLIVVLLAAVVGRLLGAGLLAGGVLLAGCVLVLLFSLGGVRRDRP